MKLLENWEYDTPYCRISKNFGGSLESKEIGGFLEVMLEVPGCGPEDINVSTHCSDGLNINGRIIAIPTYYNINQCSANIKNGLLTLKMPANDHNIIAVTGV